jgi:uncharacterized protein (TIGR01777 family)
LISGITGLIGGALQVALEDRGDTVIGLRRPSSRPLSVASIEWEPGRQQLPTELLEAQGTIDAVVHLAGAGIGDKRWTARRKAEILESRVSCTSLLATRCAAMSSPPKVFVSGSAIGYYGSRADQILTEDASKGEGFLAEVCEQWESAARPIRDAGVRTIFARTGVVLDASGGALARQLPLFRMGLGGRLGPGSQWLSWITLEDEVGALLALIDQEDYVGPVNLTAPNPVTNLEFTRSLARALHRPAVAGVPAFALSAVLGSELVHEALLCSTRAVPAALEAQGFSFAHPELDTALASII